jgi:predicted MFS family arabinose efflux permease
MPTARWWLLAGLWLVYFTFGLSITSLAPLVTLIESDLDISHAAMGSIMGAWQLVYIFSAVPCGVLLDRLGGRKSLVIGAVLIGISTLGRAVADDYWTFLAAVMLFGIGGPVVSSGAPKVVAQLFSGSDRGFAMGIYMTGPAIGGVVSLTLTHAVLLPWLGDWRAVMLLWSAIAFAGAVLWLAVSTWAGLDADDGAGAAPTQQQSQMALMQHLLVQPAVRIVLLMSVGVFLFNHGLNNWLPELLRVGGMTPVAAGYWAALPTVVGIIGSLTIPRLATPERRFNILFGLCLAAGAASLLLQSSHGVLLTAGLVMQGVARATLMTVLILTLVELPGIGEKHAGAASGLFFSAAEVGGMLGPLGLGLIYDWQGGFGGALAGLTAVTVLLAAGALYLRRLAVR